MPKVDISKAPTFKGSGYPKPFDEPCKAREGVRLGVAAGLTQFGVNIVTLPPGAWASQRHWHSHEDEGETVLLPGDCAGWKAGVKNGHHLVNRSAREARFLVVGSRSDADWGEYPDIDLRFNPDRYSGKRTGGFSHKDGRPY